MEIGAELQYNAVECQLRSEEIFSILQKMSSNMHMHHDQSDGKQDPISNLGVQIQRHTVGEQLLVFVIVENVGKDTYAELDIVVGGCGCGPI